MASMNARDDAARTVSDCCFPPSVIAIYVQERMSLAEMKHLERLAEIQMTNRAPVLKRSAAGANDGEPPAKLHTVRRVHAAAPVKLELLLRKSKLPTVPEVWAELQGVPGMWLDECRRDVIELELLRAQEDKLKPQALAEKLVASLSV